MVYLGGIRRAARPGEGSGSIAAFMAACTLGQADKALEYVLDDNIDVDTKTPDGVTALMLAAMHGHEDLVGALLSDDVGAAVGVRDHTGTTALMYANRNGHQRTAKILFAFSLWSACRAGNAAEVGSLLASGGDVDATIEYGETALMAACEQGHVACARLLLEGGAAVDQMCHYKSTALMRTCGARDAQEAQVKLPLVKLLCAYGASRERPGKWGRNSAMQIASRSHPSIGHWLDSTRQWTTPLHYIELHTPDRTMEMLRGGADPHARAAPDACSPLDVARGIERCGQAPPASSAFLLLSWWRAQLVAVAMGTHPRLGQESEVYRLSGHADVLALICHWTTRA